ncbi:MAG: hypothetical protein JSU04_19435 [Bdellovibrionales bacterium]|nr:hypothetical protein [Bdellovibrionales bacterium]
MNARKNSKLMPALTVMVLGGLMTFGYQNCSRAKFTIDEAAKAEALGKEGVFGTTPGDDGNVAGVRPGDDSNTGGKTPPKGDDSSVGGKNPQGNDSNTPKTNVPVNFSFECSNMHSDAAGGNVLTAAALKIVIVDKTNKVVCELSGDFKSQILNTKKVSFTPCPELPAGKYEAHIMDATASSSAFISKEFTQSDIQFTKNADGTYTTSSKKIAILYDFNKQNSQYSSVNKKYGNTSTDATQANCDSRVSPLIVSMNSESRGIQLTSPLDGIQFDILGENSFPRAHDKKQISWLTPEDQEYYFIVLPNKQGRVLGIDEMFGDNTKGPDGKFAANGYAALAKYDDDKDGLITEDDAIFSELRLWKDSNRDGVADPNELYTLQEKGLTVIDLHYDKRYKETDQYGNQTLMKSVVKTEDGKLHLVFDLWFRYLNITK